MNQIVLGATLPFAGALAVYLARRGRIGLQFLVLTPLAMAAGALWAVVPDLPRLVGRLDLYNRLANDPRTDVFLWHYTIDRIETNSIGSTVIFVLMVWCLLAVAWRELRHREESS